jgi:hypothetical protein
MEAILLNLLGSDVNFQSEFRSIGVNKLYLAYKSMRLWNPQALLAAGSKASGFQKWICIKILDSIKPIRQGDFDSNRYEYGP